jgi:hypothetical protein
MPTQKKQRVEDVERIRRIQQTSLEMMTVMHRGLSAIARGELSEVGALAMKRLAGQTLDEVQNIAMDLGTDRRGEEEMGRKGTPLSEVDVPTGAQASLPAMNAQRSKT